MEPLTFRFSGLGITVRRIPLTFVTCIAELMRMPMNVDERRRMRPKMRPRWRSRLSGCGTSDEIDGGEGLLIGSRSRCLTTTCWSSRLWSHPPEWVQGRSRPSVAVEVATDEVESSWPRTLIPPVSQHQRCLGLLISAAVTVHACDEASRRGAPGGHLSLTGNWSGPSQQQIRATTFARSVEPDSGTSEVVLISTFLTDSALAKCAWTSVNET